MDKIHIPNCDTKDLLTQMEEVHKNVVREHLKEICDILNTISLRLKSYMYNFWGS